MNTQYGIINLGSQDEIIKYISKVGPYLRIAVFTNTFSVKAIGSSDGSRFAMIKESIK